MWPKVDSPQTYQGSEIEDDNFTGVGRPFTYFVRAGQTVTFENIGGTLLEGRGSYIGLFSPIYSGGAIEAFIVESQSNRELVYTPSENIVI